MPLYALLPCTHITAAAPPVIYAAKYAASGRCRGFRWASIDDLFDCGMFMHLLFRCACRGIRAYPIVLTQISRNGCIQLTCVFGFNPCFGDARVRRTLFSFGKGLWERGRGEKIEIAED